MDRSQIDDDDDGSPRPHRLHDSPAVAVRTCSPLYSAFAVPQTLKQSSLYIADLTMSLRGRYIIDRLKRSVSPYLSLPCPPYGNPSYWEGCYRSLGPTDVYEWGNVTCRDLLSYDYSLQDYDPWIDASKVAATDTNTGPKLSTTLGETLNVHEKAEKDEPILILGCGNSKFGEDMFDAGWRGPLIQVDVASRVVESMSHRCQKLQITGDMQFVQDDATLLSAFNDNKAAATFDKGLVDALFCADEYQQCHDVMTSVQRVLHPGGVFTLASFSRPEFLMEHLLISPDGKDKNKDRNRNSNATKYMWGDIQIRKLDYIFLYRFQKADKTHTSARGGFSNAAVRAKSRRRR
jgi:ubiquinone/menaquinone biosynthesis C-methylase UbiE